VVGPIYATPDKELALALALAALSLSIAPYVTPMHCPSSRHRHVMIPLVHRSTAGTQAINACGTGRAYRTHCRRVGYRMERCGCGCGGVGGHSIAEITTHSLTAQTQTHTDT
jgi:hypothetical protein